MVCASRPAALRLLLCDQKVACPCHAVPSGRCRELVSAALLEEPVTVLPYMEVLQRYPGLSADEALQAYDAEFDHEREPETGEHCLQVRLACVCCL